PDEGELDLRIGRGRSRRRVSIHSFAQFTQDANARVLAIRSPARFDQAPKLAFGRGGDHSLIVHQSDQYADRECAAAEAKSVDAVAGFVIAAQEGIDVLDVAFEPKPEGAPQQCVRLERRRAYPVVIVSNLIGPPEIGRLVES